MFKHTLNISLSRLSWIINVLGMAANKFWWDDCFSRAASLAYTSLFALVPATALIFSLKSGFNLDETIVDEYMNMALQRLLPPDEDALMVNLKLQLIQYLGDLGRSVRALGYLSLPVVLVTGIALVNTIESSLNVVWRISSSMGFWSKALYFWGVITLGPLSIFISFFWYAKITAYNSGVVSQTSGLLGALDLFTAVDFLVPVLLICFILTITFYKLPSAQVHLSDAMLGALVSAVLFEILKRGFAWYIGWSTTYATFYGVLVSLPLFLFWLYLVWVVVLFGAQVAYQSGSISLFTGLKKYASELGEIGGLLGLRILCVIGERFKTGFPVPTESEIAVETGSDPVLVRTCLGILGEAHLITAPDPHTHARSLMLSPDKLTLEEIALAFRSKRFRLNNKKDDSLHSGELHFVETLRSTSRIVDPKSAVKNWTLADVLFGLEKANQKVLGERSSTNALNDES